MKYDESCAYIERLREKASKILEEGGGPGEIDEEEFYEAFHFELPEHMQSMFEDNHEALDVMILNLVNFNYNNYDGQNPYGTDQTVWEIKSENEFAFTEYDDYYKWDSDLRTNFPPVYYIELGEYQSGSSIYDMGLYFTKIENRYYFIDFTAVIGALGG